MSLASEINNVGPILFRLLDNLLRAGSFPLGEEIIRFRSQIGFVRANYDPLIRTKTFADELLECFTLAFDANVKLGSLDRVLQALFVETPDVGFQTALVQSAIVYCLSTESRIIAGIEFKSRDDVEAMMKKMKAVFDTARELAADQEDSACYQSLTFLAGALTQHLATTARPLARMVKFTLPTNMPSLVLSQRLYYEASRSEELVEENKIIHPAFCLREIRGLAS